MFLVLDLYHRYPAQHLITAGQDIDLSTVNRPWSVWPACPRCGRPIELYEIMYLLVKKREWHVYILVSKACSCIRSQKRNTRHIDIPNSVLRYTKFCWLGKHINISMKATDSPTQGQPNPREKKAKSGHWGTFSHSKLGLVLQRKQATRNPTQPNSANTLDAQ